MTGLCLSEHNEKAQTLLQSRAFLLSILVCAVLSGYYVLSYAVAVNNDTQIVPETTINPNTDTAVSIARLPSLGAAKAKAIIEYRQNGAVFKNADDLDKVKGIGPKTVENIQPYLKFE